MDLGYESDNGDANRTSDSQEGNSKSCSCNSSLLGPGKSKIARILVDNLLVRKSRRGPSANQQSQVESQSAKGPEILTCYYRND